MPTLPRPPVTLEHAASFTDREVEVKVATHADGRQIVVRRSTEVDARSGQRLLHIDALVR